ncbi:flagellar export chaperone FlgN [Rubinisphaera margarita]|uniref:flagellar export chaperone FlgN n=1 Tax=Rubinisphaera margarita TaxID=2909586 RepID=UPI001EE9919C|nr:flagellar export chaperone FlgN [Rubinisphaera margarita]MCG6156866.1 flagellar export chaperone FlgN [Rubinisphaera margarita]
MERPASPPLTGFQREIETLLIDLVTVQRQLSDVQTAKKQVLISRELEQLDQLQQTERQHQQRLNQLLGLRQHLMENMRRGGIIGNSLYQQCHHQGWLQEGRLASLFREARQLGMELRQQSWSLWTLAQKASRYYTAALELIAQGGNQQPTYEQHPQNSGGSTGGALLDASI